MCSECTFKASPSKLLGLGNGISKDLLRQERVTDNLPSEVHGTSHLQG